MKSARWTEITPSEYAWEREALDYIKARLTDSEPFRAWSNFEFIAEDGSINEVDLLVISLHKVYLVEIKSWSGVISGDPNTWRREVDAKEFLVDSPLLLANRKVKKLIGLLKTQKALAKQRDRMSKPSSSCLALGYGVGSKAGLVQACISRRSPSAAIIRISSTSLAATRGSTRAARRHESIDRSPLPSLAPWIRREFVPSQRQRHVADYVLRNLLMETDAFQDWEAEHGSVSGSKRRVRIYPLSRASSEAVRTERRRAAEREYQLLDGIAHDGILRVESLTNAEQGPALNLRARPRRRAPGSLPRTSKRQRPRSRGAHGPAAPVGGDAEVRARAPSLPPRPEPAQGSRDRAGLRATQTEDLRLAGRRA